MAVDEKIWMEYRENPQALIAKSKLIKEQIEKEIYEPLDWEKDACLWGQAS